MKVLIDTDPGIDDAIALIMALNAPELDIVGLTTVGGNASLEQTTQNALCLLEYMRQTDIPVSEGAARPIRGEFEFAYYHHGPGGLTVELPPPSISPIPKRAAEFIIESCRQNIGETTLIALGPLTNIANALQEEPHLTEWLGEIIVMGGAVEVPGNVTQHAEFNIYDDPIAANVVFSSGAPITLVGLDVCNAAYVTNKDADWLAGESHGERLTAKILGNWFSSRSDDAVFHLCDPLAVAVAINPALVSCKQANITVETEEPERLGKTTASYGTGSVKVAVSVDSKEATAFVKRLLNG